MRHLSLLSFGIILGFLSLATISCSDGDAPYDQIQEEPQPEPEPAPEENPTPEPEPEDGDDDTTIDSSASRCELAFSHTLSLGIVDPEAPVAEAPISDETFSMTIKVGVDSIALDSSTIPTYKWFLSADEAGVPVCFVISQDSTAATYYGVKGSSSMELEAVVYKAQMYLLAASCSDADLAVAAEDLVQATITIDLTTGTEISGSTTVQGSWSGTSAAFVGIAGFPKEISDEINGTYENALVTARFEGAFASDPTLITGEDCPGSGGGGTGTLAMKTVDAGIKASLGTGATLDFGTLPAGSYAVRHLELSNEGTADLTLSELKLQLAGAGIHFGLDQSGLATKTLAAGQSAMLSVYYDATGFSSMTSSVSESNTLQITSGGTETKISLLAVVSPANSGIVVRAYDYGKGTIVPVTQRAIDPASFDTQAMLVFENTSVSDFTIQKIELVNEDSTVLSLLSAQLSASSNGLDASSGFTGNDCESGQGYDNLADYCYATAVEGNTLSLLWPASTAERSVMLRVLIQNTSDASSTADLVVTYSDASGAAHHATISMSPASTSTHPVVGEELTATPISASPVLSPVSTF